MTEYKGVIFDLDGTLIDSMHIWQKIDVDFLARRGIVVPDDYMNAISHMGAYDTALYTIKRFNLNDTPEELIKEWVSMALKEYGNSKLKNGAEEYIAFLNKNNIKIAVATATEPEIAVEALKNRSFKKDICAVVTVSEVKRGKGYPDIYLKCAEKLGLLPNECIVFEDILMGIKGAKTGGFYTVGVYEKCSESNMEEIKKLCDRYIYDFKEMINKRL